MKLTICSFRIYNQIYLTHYRSKYILPGSLIYRSISIIFTKNYKTPQHGLVCDFFEKSKMKFNFFPQKSQTKTCWGVLEN